MVHEHHKQEEGQTRRCGYVRESAGAQKEGARICPQVGDAVEPRTGYLSLHQRDDLSEGQTT